MTATASTLSPSIASSGGWQAVADVLLATLHEPDLTACRGLFAAIAAHGLKGPPVWPMIVSAPGAAKTTLLKGMYGRQGFHFVDNFTPQTFISGHMRDDKDKAPGKAGLLHRIGSSGVIVASDFSTVLSKRPDYRDSVFADLRRIYDGSISKEFGHDSGLDERSWDGRITLATAVTDAIDLDKFRSVFQELGERFTLIRWPRAGGVAAALKAMDQDGAANDAALRAAVNAMLDAVPDLQPGMTVAQRTALASQGELIVRARSGIERSAYGDKEILHVPQAESNTRLPQQLAQLARGSALLDGRDEVDDDDMTLARRIGLDCVPPKRRRLLDALWCGGTLASVDMPGSTKTYARQDLAAHGLLTRKGELTADARGWSAQAGLLHER